MAAFTVYPGKAGMARAEAELDGMKREKIGELEELGACKGVMDAIGMLEAAERIRKVASELADLVVASLIIALHLDNAFRRAAMAAGRARIREKGYTGKINDHGWQMTTILLRGGLRLTLWTPYLRPSRKGWRGRPRRYRGKAGSGDFPILTALGIQDGVTPDARSEIARQIVQCASYEEARDQLRRDGMEVDISVLVRVAVSTGEEALRQRDDALEAALEGPLPERSALEGRRVRVSVDGGRVRTRKPKVGRRKGKKKGRQPFDTPWREPRLITIDVLDDEGHADPRWRVIYETTLGDADRTFTLLTGLLRLLGVHLAEVVEFVSDGAEWIWRRVEKLVHDVGIEPERTRLVLDYYHACEHIDEAISACSNLKGDAASKLYRELSRKLEEDGGAAEVIKRLRRLARGRRARAMKEQIAYFNAHIHHMEYARLRSEKLPIGSGVVESAIRRVINLRFKSSATFWKDQHVEPLVHLRAILKSGRWDAFIRAFLSQCYHLSASPEGCTLVEAVPDRLAA